MERTFFVRHGSTDSNASGVMHGWSDDPLSQLGRRQAELTALYLKAGPKIDAVYASTLMRSVETARIIAQETILAVEQLADLRELNLGAMEGQTEQQLWDYVASNSDPDRGLTGVLSLRFPKGETIGEFLQRISKALIEIGRKHEGTVLIASHGAATMVALGMWLEPTKVREWPKYRVRNCSITEVAHNPRPTLIRLSDTGHLDEHNLVSGSEQRF